VDKRVGVTKHENGGRLLVPHLDEANTVLPRVQRLHDAIDAAAQQAEGDINLPLEEGVRSGLA
jgi:hypothetical protein